MFRVKPCWFKFTTEKNKKPMLVHVPLFCTSNLPSGTALQQDFKILKVL